MNKHVVYISKKPVVRFRIQLLSDLHIDLNSNWRWEIKKYQNQTEILILAGDIGNPREKDYLELISELSKKYMFILITIGNHEYYGSTLKDTEDKIRHIIKPYKNINLLQCDKFDYAGVRFLGCTLWSSIPQSEFNIVSQLADYTKIRVGLGCLGITDTNALHDQHVEWLKQEIKTAKDLDIPVIVITHHAPSFLAIPEQVTHLLFFLIVTLFIYSM